FQTMDGEMVIAIGNDKQFKALCSILETPQYYKDQRFRTNPERLKHRDILVPLLQEVCVTKPTSYCQNKCHENNIPCGPIQNLEQAAKDPQLISRKMFITHENPTARMIDIIGRSSKLK